MRNPENYVLEVMVVICATQPYFHGFLNVNELHFLLFHYEAQDMSKHIINAGISSFITGSSSSLPISAITSNFQHY
jgi:hypothetical protein